MQVLHTSPDNLPDSLRTLLHRNAGKLSKIADTCVRALLVLPFPRPHLQNSCARFFTGMQEEVKKCDGMVHASACFRAPQMLTIVCIAEMWHPQDPG